MSNKIRYNKALLKTVQTDIENYLIKSHPNAQKSRHRTYLLLLFTTNMMTYDFISSELKTLEVLEHDYNSYLGLVVAYLKKRILKIKQCYKFPANINFGVLWAILQRTEAELSKQHSWADILEDFNSEGLQW